MSAVDRITVYVPRGLKKAVKIAAATDDLTMSEWVTRAFTDALPAFTPTSLTDPTRTDH